MKSANTISTSTETTAAAQIHIFLPASWGGLPDIEVAGPGEISRMSLAPRSLRLGDTVVVRIERSALPRGGGFWPMPAPAPASAVFFGGCGRAFVPDCCNLS